MKLQLASQWRICNIVGMQSLGSVENKICHLVEPLHESYDRIAGCGQSLEVVSELTQTLNVVAKEVGYSHIADPDRYEVLR